MPLFEICQLTNEESLTNKVFVSTDSFLMKNKTLFVKINEFIYNIDSSPIIKTGFIGLNLIHRRQLNLSFQDKVNVIPYNPIESILIGKTSIKVEFFSKKVENVENVQLTTENVINVLKSNFDQFMFNVNQKFAFKVNSITLEGTILSIETFDPTTLASNNNCNGNGILFKGSEITLKSSEKLKFDSDTVDLFQPNWNVADIGIGGLNKEFGDIFRRAFTSRLFPPLLLKKMGLQHVKGILLYGPPGTGKTLIARQIGKMLNTKEPKIVNGPSILDKYVGGSEQKIRDLFADAQAEYKSKGDSSQLHIIIFDEIDAICKSRGTVKDNTGVSDSVVNQLLSMIDGVDSLNNVLLIGMTNRKDMIDEALLRPGRFEVQIEITLPNEEGRFEIFQIQTKDLLKNEMLDNTVHLNELAKLTVNFSGAEIAGLVRTASSYAMNREVDVNTGTRIKNSQNPILKQSDFIAALKEIKPAFGTDDFSEYDSLIEYNNITDILKESKLIITTISNSIINLGTILLCGRNGSGTTTLAVNIAKNCGYPFIKIISPYKLIGPETMKLNYIQKIFDDAYKSPIACIVIDEIERLLEYIQIGPRFSNSVLQALLVLLKRKPANNHKLLIIGTTNNKNVLINFDIYDCFDKVFNLNYITSKIDFEKVLYAHGITNQVISKCNFVEISIKKLLFIIQISKNSDLDFADMFNKQVEEFKEPTVP
jgi:vesicle-fusing ATPase